MSHENTILVTVTSLCLWLSFPSTTFADFSGRVIHVADGDTLTVLVEKTQVKVRLDSIDAPERKQPFGRRSADSLKALCAGKMADIKEMAKDRYGRTVGRVTCAGQDANAVQVRNGWAWVYVRYAPKNSALYALEADARAGKRGLWSDAAAVPPWDWRQERRRLQNHNKSD